MLGSSASGSLLGVIPLARNLFTSSLANAAAPAVAKSSSGGVASMFGFGGSRIDTPLSEPLPALPKPHKNVPSAAPSVQTGSLQAGTKVVAIDNAASPISSVSLVFEGGAAFEDGAHLGASRVLEAMAYKASTNRTTFRLTRELEKIGALATAKAGRDHIAYNISAARMHTPEVVEMLLDSVFNARINHWEVQEALEIAKATLTAEQRDATKVLVDVLHRAAFDGPLGQPLHLDPALLDGVSKATLKEYLASTLHPSRAVLAAAGVGIDEFTQLANPLVEAGSNSAASVPNSPYVSGSLNVIQQTSPYTYVGAAIEAKGGLSSAKSAAAAAVVKVLLDEGRAVLPRAVKEHDVFISAQGFNNMYKNTGLVGMIASTAPAQAQQLVDAVVKKFEGLTKPVPDAQLKNAKQLAIGAFRNQIATSRGLAATAAPTLLATGKFSPSEVVSNIEGLTANDVSSFVSNGLKGGVTFASYGSMSTKVPRFESIAKRLT